MRSDGYCVERNLGDSDLRQKDSKSKNICMEVEICSRSVRPEEEHWREATTFLGGRPSSHIVN